VCRVESFERLEQLRVVQKPPNWPSDLLVNHEPSDVIFSPVELRQALSLYVIFLPRCFSTIFFFLRFSLSNVICQLSRFEGHLFRAYVTVQAAFVDNVGYPLAGNVSFQGKKRKKKGKSQEQT